MLTRWNQWITKGEKIEEKIILLFFFGFENVYFKSWCGTLRFRNYSRLSGLGLCLRFDLFKACFVCFVLFCLFVFVFFFFFFKGLVLTFM